MKELKVIRTGVPIIKIRNSVESGEGIESSFVAIITHNIILRDVESGEGIER